MLNNHIRVKICGLTDPQEAAYVNEAGADFAGMVLFVPKSKRNITIDTAKAIMRELDSRIASVAVTIEPTEEQVRAIEEAGFSYLQVHGQMADELLDTVQIPVLKAFNVKDLSEYAHYAAHPRVAGFVLDAQVPGSGKAFDYAVLEELMPEIRRIQEDKTVLLAGGLDPQNVAEAIRMTGIRGVDVSSGVERTDGAGKDPEKVRAFVKAARNA